MHKQGEKKVTRACVDARWDALEAAALSSARPTAKQKRAAAEVCADLARAEEGPHWRVPVLPLVVVGALLVLLLLSGGCVPVDVAAEHAAQQAVNAHGLSQRGSSEAVRAVGSAESFAWRMQHQILTGEDVPAPQGVVWEPLPEAVPVSPQ